MAPLGLGRFELGAITGSSQVFEPAPTEAPTLQSPLQPAPHPKLPLTQSCFPIILTQVLSLVLVKVSDNCSATDNWITQMLSQLRREQHCCQLT